MEKQLVDLNETNMREQSKNYKLQNRYKFFSQKSKMSIQRVTMLQEKIKFLTENMKQQMLEQQENANEVDVEFKRLQMEL